jgi:hypothetical protein
MNGDRHAGHYLLQQTQAWRYSAIGQFSAKLNTVGTPARRNLSVRKGFDAKLQRRLQGSGGG